jgi:hypothetical protein
MFEHRRQPLLPRAKFVIRVIGHAAMALGIIVVALAIGVVGYHHLGSLSWVDAILNAAMILGGMGPVDVLHATGAKLFAAAYALFSGVLFLVVAGVLFAPVVHRVFHRFHLEMEADDSPRG